MRKGPPTFRHPGTVGGPFGRLEGWFGQGLLTRPSFATAVPDRRRVTWRPTVGRTAGSGDPRRTKPNGGVGRLSPNDV